MILRKCRVEKPASCAARGISKNILGPLLDDVLAFILKPPCHTLAYEVRRPSWAAPILRLTQHTIFQMVKPRRVPTIPASVFSGLLGSDRTSFFVSSTIVRFGISENTCGLEVV